MVTTGLLHVKLFKLFQLHNSNYQGLPYSYTVYCSYVKNVITSSILRPWRKKRFPSWKTNILPSPLWPLKNSVPRPLAPWKDVAPPQTTPNILPLLVKNDTSQASRASNRRLLRTFIPLTWWSFLDTTHVYISQKRQPVVLVQGGVLVLPAERNND